MKPIFSKLLAFLVVVVWCVPIVLADENPCSLVAQVEVEEVLQSKVRKSVSGRAINQSTFVFLSENKGTVTASLFNDSPMDPNARWKGLKQNATEAMGQLEEVSGVGEDANYTAKSGILFFKKKDKIATVNLAANSILGATAKRSIAKALGRKMAERL